MLCSGLPHGYHRDYQLLKDIRAVGSDLEFRGSNIGAPSVDIGNIHVAGK